MRTLRAVEPAFVQVIEAWRAASLRTGWLRPGDWWHPVVEDVVAAIDDDFRIIETLEALGAARAEHGVGIGETIDDVAALFESLGRPAPPLRLVRALSEGWASPAGMPPVPGTVMDPETGLPTLEYLSVRIVEEYARVRRQGGSPATDLHLVLLDVAHGPVSPWARIARSATAGRAIEVALGQGWPAASLGGGLFVVLHDRPGTLDDDVVRLRDTVAEHAARMGVSDLLRQPPRIWVEAAPAHPQVLTARLGQLRRRL